MFLRGMAFSVDGWGGIFEEEDKEEECLMRVQGGCDK